MKDNCEEPIVEGMHILVVRGEQERIIEFRPNDVLHYGKGNSQQSIELKNVAGMPNYSCFRVKLHSVQPPSKQSGALYYLEALDDIDQLSLSAGEVTERGKDNRDIVDDNKSQKMNAADIQELRGKGASGSEILETLISNSSSFSKKTEFSQSKYVKKKEKTYGDTLLFIKPTLSTVADHYFKKDAARILNLRPDTLSQILTYANVHAHGKYLIYENGCCGLVVGGVLSRLAGTGLILHVHTGSTPQRQAINYLNLSEHDLVPLKNLDIFYLTRPPHSKNVAKGDESQISKEAQEIMIQENDEVPSKKIKLEDITTLSPSKDFVPGKIPVSINRAENERSRILLESTKFSSLIIAGKEHPLSILQRLLPHLTPSAPIVIFCQIAEPLADCYTWLKDNNCAANIFLVENWLRNIQVDTERTHPEINMSGTGGFLLTGICTYQKKGTIDQIKV